jgi:hypothetical protein
MCSRSENKVALNKWHTLNVWRTGRAVLMKLSGQSYVEAVDPLHIERYEHMNACTKTVVDNVNRTRSMWAAPIMIFFSKVPSGMRVVASAFTVALKRCVQHNN